MTARRDPVAVLVPLLVAAVQLACACVVLGTPDLAAAMDFLTGTAPGTMAGGVAAAQLILWAALAVAFLASLAAALTRTVGAARSAGRTAIWSLMVMATGTLILAAGVDHRSSSGSVTLTGGSLQEARAQLGP